MCRQPLQWATRKKRIVAMNDDARDLDQADTQILTPELPAELLLTRGHAKEAAMQIENAVPYIGALVTGLDVKRMTNSEWQTLYQTWLDRHVLIVRGQALSKAD